MGIMDFEIDVLIIYTVRNIKGLNPSVTLSTSSLDAYVTITSYGQTVSYPYNLDKKSEVGNFSIVN